MGLVEKGKQDERTNYYTLIRCGQRELEAHVRWISEDLRVLSPERSERGYRYLGISLLGSGGAIFQCYRGAIDLQRFGFNLMYLTSRTNIRESEIENKEYDT